MRIRSKSLIKYSLVLASADAVFLEDRVARLLLNLELAFEKTEADFFLIVEYEPDSDWRPFNEELSLESFKFELTRTRARSSTISELSITRNS